MTRQELTNQIDRNPAASTDISFQLGMRCAIGAEAPVDYVAAHKWFNHAAMRDKAEAMTLRREIASEMCETEITAAQRASPDFLKALTVDRHTARNRMKISRRCGTILLGRMVTRSRSLTDDQVLAATQDRSAPKG